MDNDQLKVAQAAYDRTCEIVGTNAAIARHFGLTPWATSKWRNGPPMERCPDLEKLTQGKVRCEEFRPDIDWAYLRARAPEAIEQQTA